ncbi:MAG TPA: hypothetical protein VKS79_21750, partial [Gemmataceae bacterium]|nr:hypothetical protein [Gemmataceae bacterium]
MLRIVDIAKQTLLVPGSAWERTAARLCLAARSARQSLADSAFPGRAWERGWRQFSTALIYIALMFICWLIYRVSPGYPQICDSRYSLLITENLLESGHMNLDRYMPPDRPLPYQVTRLPRDSHVYYAYPLGSSFLSTPFVAWWQSSGISGDNPAYTDPLKRDTEWQRRLAAILAAGCVGWFLWLARLFLDWKWSLAIALFWGFGSPIWSTLSRGLWSHDWMVWFLALAIVFLVRLDQSSARGWRWSTIGTGALLGCCLFSMYFCRPQSLVSAIGILCYLLCFHWRILISALTVFSVSMLALVAWSTWTFGQPLPPSVYATFRPETGHLLRNASGLLISPSRGVLTFCPGLLFLAWGLVRYRRTLPNRRLLLPVWVAICGHFAVLACFSEWHGGCCYGPRYFTDVLPWAVLLSVQAIRGMFDHIPTCRQPISAREARPSAYPFSGFARVMLFACIAWSVWIHGRGAIAPATWRWNYHMEREPKT